MFAGFGVSFSVGLVVGLCSLDFACFLLRGLLFSEFAAGGGLIVVFGLIAGALGRVCGPAFGVWFLRLRFGFGLGLRVGCC